MGRPFGAQGAPGPHPRKPEPQVTNKCLAGVDRIDAFRGQWGREQVATGFNLFLFLYVGCGQIRTTTTTATKTSTTHTQPDERKKQQQAASRTREPFQPNLIQVPTIHEHFAVLIRELKPSHSSTSTCKHCASASPKANRKAVVLPVDAASAKPPGSKARSFRTVISKSSGGVAKMRCVKPLQGSRRGEP